MKAIEDNILHKNYGRFTVKPTFEQCIHRFSFTFGVLIVNIDRTTMESISVFDIFKIGVGPSSSHTLGPWKASLAFLELIKKHPLTKIEIELYGSLSKTGKGHGTDIAIMLGLQQYHPETIDTTSIHTIIEKVKQQQQLTINNSSIYFNPDEHIIFKQTALPFHANGMWFKALFDDGSTIDEKYYSIGGGFIVTEHETNHSNNVSKFPYPIETEADLLKHLNKNNKSIAEVVLANECYLQDKETVYKKLSHIWEVMLQSVYNGCHTAGVLPGCLNVTRRAKSLNKKLIGNAEYNDVESWLKVIQQSPNNFAQVNNWITCFALAVNEENASFGRIVTAPTNGAAGVIPAVMLYYYCFCENEGIHDLIRFLLIASEIGSIFKKGATISAAAGGCQAEIGVSSSMAAAALTELQGGSPQQALMAAEIAMEHHLGLTCDPIKGLVQVPCIERNSMGAIKAITASNLALNSNPNHAIVNLDKVVKTMWETAQDMSEKYKETAEGGLAINVSVGIAEC